MKKLLASLILLSGCSGYKSSYECPASKGVACRDGPEIDWMVDHGKINLRLVNDGQIVVHKDISQPQTRGKSAPIQVIILGYKDDSGKNHRTKRVVLN